MPICPVCKSNLKNVTKSHINTKKHKDALKKLGIAPSQDPALELISKTSAVKSTTKNQINKTGKVDNSKIYSQLKKKILNLEANVKNLQRAQEEIIKKINVIYKNVEPEKLDKFKRKLKYDEIFRAIDKCANNNESESRWVKIDDVISILKLNREQDRINLNKLLIKMFNKNLIDLAEGGDPKYPIIYQNRIFGMLAHQ